MSSGEAESPAFDTSVAHIARVYDYWLGGKDNYPVDRAVGERVMQAYPDIVYSVRANRAFLDRVVRYLVGEVGDQAVPRHRDRHPDREQHPRGRSVGGPGVPGGLRGQRPDRARPRPGACWPATRRAPCDYIEADLRDTGEMLARAAQVLDFSEPVAVMLLGILHMISDQDDPSRSRSR